MEEGSETSTMLAVTAGGCEADDSCVLSQPLSLTFDTDTVSALSISIAPATQSRPPTYRHPYDIVGN